MTALKRQKLAFRFCLTFYVTRQPEYHTDTSADFICITLKSSKTYSYHIAILEAVEFFSSWLEKRENGNVFTHQMQLHKLGVWRYWPTARSNGATLLHYGRCCAFANAILWTLVVTRGCVSSCCIYVVSSWCVTSDPWHQWGTFQPTATACWIFSLYRVGLCKPPEGGQIPSLLRSDVRCELQQFVPHLRAWMRRVAVCDWPLAICAHKQLSIAPKNVSTSLNIHSKAPMLLWEVEVCMPWLLSIRLHWCEFPLQ